MKNQRRVGVAISYINIVLNMALSIFFTPFLLRSLGDAEYGIYKMMHSFAGQLSIMSFGMSTVVARNIVMFNTRCEEDKKKNFLFLANTISLFLMISTLAAGFILYQFIEPLYGSNLSTSDMVTAKRLFVLMIINVALTIFGDSFVGVVRGHEQFAVSYSTKTFKLVARTVLIICLINMGYKSTSIIMADLSLTVAVILFEMLYSRIVLKEVPKFSFWDKEIIKVTFAFSIATLFRAIVTQVNQNLDSVILGAMTSSKTVAMYSLGITIYVTYNSITNTIASVFAPQAVRAICSGADSKMLTDFVVKPGRIQFALSCAIIGGFTVFGNSFIDLWVGKAYRSVYPVVLLLIIPSVIPIMTSVSNSLLDAKLKQMGRTIIAVIMSVINLGTSIVLVRFVGYIGAALGTAAANILGYGIINNIYLHKVLGLEILRLYLDTIKGILPCCLITTLVLFPAEWFLPNNVLTLLLKIVSYVVVFLLLLCKFGFNDYEKEEFVYKPLNYVLRKRNKRRGG